MTDEREFKKDDKVWYHPVVTEKTRYAATVVTEAFSLGDDICHHIDVKDPAYNGGKRKRLYAAWTRALEARDD
jgi:hypothetical protein